MLSEFLELAKDKAVTGILRRPFAVRVQIALSIKGLDYENIVENLKSKSELLLQSNPVYKKFPVLIHGDKPICESANVVEYIDEVWKDNGAPSILPSNAYDRATARSHQSEVSVQRVKKEEVESKISAWQNDKVAKINNRFKREDAVINGWENEQVQKANSWMKKVELLV